MPRKYSLSRADFAKTRGFKRLLGTALSLSYGSIPGRLVPGGAVVVSKKVAKGAAERNRLKRALRPVLFGRLQKLDSPSLIVTVRKKVPTREARTELERLLASLGIS